jgi:hypothetical protein
MGQRCRMAAVNRTKPRVMTPAQKERKLELQRQRRKDLEYRAREYDQTNKRRNEPETKARYAKARQTPEYRKRAADRARERRATPAAKARYAEYRRELAENPARHAYVLYKRLQSRLKSGWTQKLSESAKERNRQRGRERYSRKSAAERQAYLDQGRIARANRRARMALNAALNITADTPVHPSVRRKLK